MRKALMIMGVLAMIASLLGCGTSPTQQPGSDLSPAQQRKARTEAELKKLCIPINQHLPPLKGEEEARIRTPQDVAKRAVVLFVLVAVASGDPSETAVAWLQDEELWDTVSPDEKAFFLSDHPAEQEITDALWRSEALWALLWALGKVQALSLPPSQCDMSHLQDVMPGKSAWRGFIDTARLRSESEILDKTDRISEFTGRSGMPNSRTRPYQRD
jgi:predicted small lipoprotein YifL